MDGKIVVDSITKRFGSGAHASGQITVIVEPMPNPGLMRLRWRLFEFAHAVLTY